jgi:cytochrome c-type biogenesis protein
VLPLAIPYLAWIGAIGVDGSVASRRTAFVRTACFVAGFVTVFMAFGITATALGRWLAESHRTLEIVAGAMLIVLGLHVARLIRIPFIDMEARAHVSARPGGVASAYLVGVAFAFGWSPCVGPMLAAILAVAAAQESIARGALLLAVYGVAMGVPFLFGAVLTAPFTRLAGRVAAFGRGVEWVSAGLIIGTGALVMSGQFYRIGVWLIETFPVFARMG